MVHALLQLRRLLRSFATDREGAAVVEFALIVPLLLFLYMGSVEASSLYTVDRRVTTISDTMADLVSRSDGVIAQDKLNDYFRAAEGIIIPYSTSGLHQVVSVISVDQNGAARVVWSRAFNGGTQRAPNSTYPLASTTQMNLLARGGWLVAAETSYSYTPVLGVVFQQPIGLYHESLYLPRFGDRIDLS
jgi:Flp pilus assembly protein TadG